MPTNNYNAYSNNAFNTNQLREFLEFVGWVEALRNPTKSY
jgi:hypothetical protein